MCFPSWKPVQPHLSVSICAFCAQNPRKGWSTKTILPVINTALLLNLLFIWKPPTLYHCGSNISVSTALAMMALLKLFCLMLPFILWKAY
ncbi:MAG: hypothetical protein J3Q66DRAFT_334089 [Benniella sp.]|nr:MAG: hypothetical protein J3Q66DRAFT_334089 [Benniella sp.]